MSPLPAPGPSPFAIQTRSLDTTVIVSVLGEVDIATAPRLYAALTKAAARGGPVVLDMSRVEFLGSTGIREILDAWQESRHDGFAMRLLTRGNNNVMRALAYAGVLDEMPFVRRS